MRALGLVIERIRILLFVNEDSVGGCVALILVFFPIFSGAEKMRTIV
jgi:hypothetical protein